MNGLEPGDVRVEVFEGPLEADGTMESGYTVPLGLVSSEGSRSIFRGEHSRPEHGGIGWAVRARPHHPDLVGPNETGLLLWSGARPREAMPYGG